MRAKVFKKYDEIKLLSPNIINEIAAGEVMGSSAVVKELIENSIDSGADKITIGIKSGGLSEITVLDNGKGIDRKYLEMSVKKHTTSKLNKSSLNNLITLGFRGEALYAISNAANFLMISKTKNEKTAFQLRVAFGKISKLKPSKGNIGTYVKVENHLWATC